MFEVYKTQCKNCLLSPDSIVFPEVRKDIIKDIIKDSINSGSYFVCHNASYAGKETCCRKFFDTLGDKSQIIRLAKRFNAVTFVYQPEEKKLISFREMEKCKKQI